MLQILNMQSFLEGILPELAERLRRFSGQDWNGSLAVGTRKVSTCFRIEGDQIRLEETSKADLDICLDERSLLRLVFGICSFSQINYRHALSQAQQKLLSALFPQKLVTGGAELWGPDNQDLEYEVLSHSSAPERFMV